MPMGDQLGRRESELGANADGAAQSVGVSVKAIEHAQAGGTAGSYAQQTPLSLPRGPAGRRGCVMASSHGERQT